MNVSKSDILSASCVSLDSLLHVSCYMCVCVRSSTVSSLRSDGNDGSVVAELESSHVLGRGNWPFNTHQPIRQGMLGAGRPWERPCRGAEGWRGYRGKSTQKGQIKESERGVGTEGAGRMEER